MGTVGHVLSDNKVVQGGLAYFEDQIVGSTGAVTPGALVIRDTTDLSDEKVMEAGAAADNVVGVADVIFTEKQAVGTDIASGDPVRVGKGLFLFRGLLAAGESVVKGDLLAAAAGGELAAAGVGEHVWAKAEQTVDNSGGGAAVACLSSFIVGGIGA